MTIYAMAFAACPSLKSLYLRLDGSIITTLQQSTAFASTPIADSSYLGEYGSIYVNASLLEKYKSATNWVQYSDRLVGLTDEEFDAIEANW